jgi:hypothetical protein
MEPNISEQLLLRMNHILKKKYAIYQLNMAYIPLIIYIRFYLKYSAPDNLKIREEEDNVHEIEPNTPKNRYTMIIRTIKKI